MATEINIKEFLDKATDAQKGLLKKLTETAQKENELCDKINRVYASMKSGVYSPDGFSITVCEDEDDAIIISAKDQEELDRVKGIMKGYMIEAVNLGMGNLGIIQRNYKEYVGKDIPIK
jgi:hypothetical protein